MKTVLVALTSFWLASSSAATTSGVCGRVLDPNGAALPGVVVEIASALGPVAETVSDEQGRFEFAIASGRYRLTFRLPQFSELTRDVMVDDSVVSSIEVTMDLRLTAAVTVTGERTFRNLADVERPQESLVGLANAASEGAVTARQLEMRPILRAGDVIESVPGVVVSQHSAEGKANQFYLRGFNLDHGADLSVRIAGVPVNLPTHAHGQGYVDLNFLIPELIASVQYKKGPYHADEGDFSAAGAASINYVNALDAPIARVGFGGDGWGRTFLAASPRLGDGRLLAAIELNRNDGPWVEPERHRRANGVLRYSRGDTVNGLAVTAMGYRSTWMATDQIPQRAVDANMLSRFGSIDASDGGSTHRYSLSVEWQRTRGGAATRVLAYGVNYKLNLFSNFTYFLDDPVNGDQFEQAEQRFVLGGEATHRRLTRWRGRPVEFTAGAQIRRDDLDDVGLYRTSRRARLATTREDDVQQTAAGAYAQAEVRWSRRLRSVAGLRGDLYDFRVTADNPVNSGRRTDGMLSPKLAVVAGPFRGTELYANAGFGFHSNDARGTTTRQDPVSGETLAPATPLVRARGAEMGVRTVAIPRVQTTLAVWTLSLDSELLFVADAGGAEASRPSRRTGVEWSTYYRPNSWLTIDFDLAASRARFSDDDAAGPRIPGAAAWTGSAGAAIEDLQRWFGGVRYRYVGARPLIEDGSVRSRASQLLNAQIGWRLTRAARVSLDVFNLLNARASDIDYFYTSRLPGEPLEGVADRHTHPVAPRAMRLSISYRF